jgi:hypothetical protein
MFLIFSLLFILINTALVVLQIFSRLLWYVGESGLNNSSMKILDENVNIHVKLHLLSEIKAV